MALGHHLRRSRDRWPSRRKASAEWRRDCSWPLRLTPDDGEFGRHEGFPAPPVIPLHRRHTKRSRPGCTRAVWELSALKRDDRMRKPTRGMRGGRFCGVPQQEPRSPRCPQTALLRATLVWGKVAHEQRSVSPARVLRRRKKGSCADNPPRIRRCNVKLRRTSGRSIERAHEPLTGTSLGQAKKAAHPLQG